MLCLVVAFMLRSLLVCMPVCLLPVCLPACLFACLSVCCCSAVTALAQRSASNGAYCTYLVLGDLISCHVASNSTQQAKLLPES